MQPIINFNWISQRNLICGLKVHFHIGNGNYILRRSDFKELINIMVQWLFSQQGIVLLAWKSRLRRFLQDEFNSRTKVILIVGQKEGSPISFREGRKYSPPCVGETPYAISPLKPDKEKASGLN